MSGGCGREYDEWRQTYHIHPLMSVAILCGKWLNKKLQLIFGQAETKEEFAAGKMCASLKAAMGMLVIDGNESAMVALF